MRLRDKVVFLTGGASGIGQSMVERFALEGAVVNFIDINNQKGLALAARIDNAHFLQTDLAEPAAIRTAVEQCILRHGKIDILVNNAAVILPKSVAEISVAEWDRLIDINLRAPFLLIQAALPALQKSQGTILNIASTAALRVFGDNVPYISAKAGLIAMTKALALDFHRFGIRVNCICPGAVQTPLLDEDIRLRAGNREDVLGSLAQKRILVQPEAIAEAALHLVSEAASGMTGSIVVVDAGEMLL